MASFDELGTSVADGGVHFQRQNVYAGDHNILRHGITKAENREYHLPLTFFERAFGLIVLHPVSEGVVCNGERHFFGMLSKHQGHQMG